MSEKYNGFFGSDTQRIIAGLTNGSEYNDPFKVQEMFASDTFEIVSFSQELWNTMLTRFPCKLCRNLYEAYTYALENNIEPEMYIYKKLDSSKKSAWKAYCSQNTALNKDGALAFVFDFLRTTCTKKPFCRPCECKEKLVNFDVKIHGNEKMRDSARRNISNRLSKDIMPTDREAFIQMCYALNLRIVPSGAVNRTSEARLIDANRFLSFACSQNPLYVGAIDEAVHYFCLKRPLGQKLGLSETYDGAKNYALAKSIIEDIKKMPKSCENRNDYTMLEQNEIDSIESIEELKLYLAGKDESTDKYRSTKECFKTFIYDYEAYLNPVYEIKKNKKRRERPRIKTTAQKFINILQTTCKLEGQSDIKKMIAKYSLADILYASEMLQMTVRGELEVDRTLLLLTLLVLDCGFIFDGNEKIEIDFPVSISFHDFFDTISSTLKNCGMAPLYPKRKIDFLILYTYYLCSVDFKKGRKEVEDLGSYFIKTIKIINCGG